MNERGVLLFDSAMGTALMAARALGAGERTEYANLNAPETVARIHRENIEAGCDIITTNTFGANGWMNGSAEAEAALRAGVRIARRAADAAPASGRQVLVALDVGPLGELLGFTPGLDAARARALFAEMIHAGVSEGADLILIETMVDLTELSAALAAAGEAAPGFPALCSMSFDTGGRTFMGATVPEFVAAARVGGAAAVGANCMLDPAEMAGVADALLASAAGTQASGTDGCDTKNTPPASAAETPDPGANGRDTENTPRASAAGTPVHGTDGRNTKNTPPASAAETAAAAASAAQGEGITDTATNERTAAAAPLPVLIQPNAGQPVLSGGEATYEMTPGAFAEGMRALLNKGVRIAGGCCGTTPEMVALIRGIMNEDIGAGRKR